MKTNNQTPLIKAVGTIASELQSTILKADDVTKVKKLLNNLPENVKNIALNRKYQGKTPVVLACEKAKFKILKYLVGECNVDIESKSQNGLSLFQIACKGNHLKLVKYLFKRGCNIHILDSHGRTCVMLAIKHPDICTFLIKQGVDVCITDRDNKTVLHYINEVSGSKVVELIIKHRVNVNQQDVTGNTALHSLLKSTSGSFRIKVTDILISNGIDLNARDCNGKTVLHIAFEVTVPYKLIQTLLSNGASARIKDNDGNRPIESAGLSEFGTGKVDILVWYGKLSIAEIIEAYEITISSILPTLHDEMFMQVFVLEFFSKAQNLRQKHELLFKQTTTMNSILSGFTEPNTFHDMQMICTSAEDCVRAAALIQSRILGPNSPVLLSTLMRLGYPSELGNRANDSIYAKVMSHVFAICSEKIKQGSEKDLLALKGYLETSICVRRFHNLSNESRLNNCLWYVDVVESLVQESPTSDFHSFIDRGVDACVYLYKNLAGQEERIKEILVKIINTYRRNCQNNMFSHRVSFLHDFFHHMVYHNVISLVDGAFKRLVMALVEQREPIDIRDLRGNTPLHLYLCEILHDKKQDLLTGDDKDWSVVELFLANGNHVDAVNSQGDCTLDMLEKLKYPIEKMNYLSLQCLAAVAIVRNGVPYANILPETIVSFVEIHDKLPAYRA